VSSAVRRLLLPPAALLLATAAFSTAGAAPIVRTIQGSPLTINIADDTSMQIVTSETPDVIQFNPVQFNPTTCGAGQTGDAGVLVSVGGVVFGPDFRNHPCGSAANTYVPWTPVSISQVSGSGTPSDPFAVVLVADAGATGLRLTETLSYINGTATFTPTIAFANRGSAGIQAITFLAIDTNLGAHYVHPRLVFGSLIGQASDELGAPLPACKPDAYYLAFPAAERYSGNNPPQLWNEISGSSLSDTLGLGCSHSGLAVQWTTQVGPGAALTLSTQHLSFVSDFPPDASVPMLSGFGIACLVTALAVIGFALGRRA
jgi:hypothetical protein